MLTQQMPLTQTRKPAPWDVDYDGMYPAINLLKPQKEHWSLFSCPDIELGDSHGKRFGKSESRSWQKQG